MPDDMCQTTDWTGWSECSTTCGKGYELRTRRFLNRMGRKKCPHVETTERRSCAGSEATCPGTPEAETRVLANPDCAVTSWSDWSPCSVSCGKLTLSIEARRSKSLKCGYSQCAPDVFNLDQKFRRQKLFFYLL